MKTQTNHGTTSEIDTDPWTEWHGGICPVADRVKGDLRLRDGTLIEDVPLSCYHWEHGATDPYGDNIIAYRTRTP